jgi:hypothetical protein
MHLPAMMTRAVGRTTSRTAGSIRRHSMEGTLMRPRLKLFTGDDRVDATAEPQVSVTLGEVANLLVEAQMWDRTWLLDFRDEKVKISADLYEVLTAYSNLRPSA